MSYLPFPKGIHYFCMLYCIVFLGVVEMSKTRASCFIRVPDTSVFGTPDETLALVFDILRHSHMGHR